MSEVQPVENKVKIQMILELLKEFKETVQKEFDEMKVMIKEEKQEQNNKITSLQSQVDRLRSERNIVYGAAAGISLAVAAIWEFLTR